MKRSIWLCLCLTVILLVVPSCMTSANKGNENEDNNDYHTNPLTTLLQPEDLTYVGAFRLPAGSGGSNWEWSGSPGGLAYYPDGDANGPDDGYPGSLFGTGYDVEMLFSEIAIPLPVVSPGKNPADLNTARTLQPFHDILGDLVDVRTLEIPRVGLEYLPPQGNQTGGKLYFCWAEHFQEQTVSHGWCNPDLANPQTAGGWYVGDYRIYSVNDYLFEIPASWAQAYTPGKRLATGRFRDGGWSGQGPSLFTIGPWNHGSPPPPGTKLAATPLLLYTSTEDYDAPQYTMEGYHHSDEWSGGAWITAGEKTAVIFVGTKGTGNCWYGDSNGPCDECAGERGWWSDGFEGQIIFYDPADLAEVAQGLKQPHEPQPYASLNIDQHLYHLRSDQQWHHLGAAAFDRQRGLLYVIEPLADHDKSLIHTWKVNK